MSLTNAESRSAKPSTPAEDEAGRNGAPFRAPRTARHAALRIIITIASAAAFAVLLEAGTLEGSFTRSPANPVDWTPRRMLFFGTVGALLGWWASGIDWRAWSKVVARWWRDPEARHARQLALALASVLGGMAMSWLLDTPCAHLAGNDGDPRYGVILSSLLVPALLLITQRSAVRTDASWGFLAIALPVGIALCALMPIPAEISWDGANHFDACNGISYLQDAEFTPADKTMAYTGDKGSLTLTGLRVDESVLTQTIGMQSLPHAKMDYQSVRHATEMTDSLDPGDPALISLPVGRNTVLGGSWLKLSTLGRVPNAAGLWLGRLLHLPATGRYALGRLTNMLLYVLVMFAAIRRLRSGKLILACIALAPTSMILAANYSYDPWNIALITYATARFVGQIQWRRPIEARDTIVTLAILYLGCAPKFVMFPLALCLLATPGARFAPGWSRSKHLCLVWVTTIAIVILGVSALFFMWSSGSLVGDTRGGSDVDVARQLAYVLGNPLEALRTWMAFALRILNPKYSVLAMAPGKDNILAYAAYLVPSEAPFTRSISLLCWVPLLVATALDRDECDQHVANHPARTSSLITCIVTFGCIIAALYVKFTPVGMDTVKGVQYRYLLPMLPAFFLIVLNFGPRRRRGETVVARHLPEAVLWSELAICALTFLNDFVIWF